MDAFKLTGLGSVFKSTIASLVWIGTLLVVSTPAAAQTPQEIVIGTPVEGQIAPGGAESWMFTTLDEAVLSFSVEATGGNLDPVLSIENNAGVTLIRNDDYAYPARHDALLEAITIPRTGTYTVTVSGFGNTSGAYSLSILPGYAQTIINESFDGGATWLPDNALLTAETGEGRLTLAIEGIQERGVASDNSSAILGDFYAQVNVANTQGQNGWIAGMTVRQQNADNYYLFSISNQGLWRFLLHTQQGDTMLRDWTTHPAIVAGEQLFTLGVLANGPVFDLFYSGQLIGQVRDETLSNPGRVGLTVGTANAVGSSATAQFDDLLATIPLEVGGTLIFPQQFMVESGPAIVQTLQRQHLIPPVGEMALTVPESFAQNVRPGVSRVMLGRGTAFTNFALGTRFRWVTSGEGSGCGLVFRSNDEENYTAAYLDSAGSYGVSQRAGDSFQPGIFGNNPEWVSDLQGNSNDLLVIADRDTLYFYVNRVFIGTMENAPVDGEVGNVVVNFAPLDTSCQFEDTWLWRWE